MANALLAHIVTAYHVPIGWQQTGRIQVVIFHHLRDFDFASWLWLTFNPEWRVFLMDSAEEFQFDGFLVQRNTEAIPQFDALGCRRRRDEIPVLSWIWKKIQTVFSKKFSKYLQWIALDGSGTSTYPLAEQLAGDPSSPSREEIIHWTKLHSKTHKTYLMKQATTIITSEQRCLFAGFSTRETYASGKRY